LLDEKTSAPTYKPAKPERIERRSKIRRKSPAVRLGSRLVIHECLVAKPWSSERIAANSKTRKRYESETSIAIQARGRQARNRDVMPIAEAMEVMTRRTRSFLVSFVMVGLRILAMLLRRKSASYLKLASA
jgi:predicted subunit of tRNA(5-methylaminomethyl-2-thiouridylate) methyltransferase